MSQSVRIGVWVEAESREVTRTPGYYAADHETLRTTPGEYDLYVVFVGGYMVPMPYWVTTGVAAVRVSGRLYDGFGGMNYSHVDLPAGEAVTYGVQLYAYSLPELVEAGRVRLDPGFEWLARRGRVWQAPEAPRDWEAVAALGRRDGGAR